GYLIFFFFSSRRRHTRSKRDWSSDVCSSDLLYLDIGDHVDLSAPVTEATMGIKNVELLNQAHCDIATIGNNEGMTISHDALNTLYDNAEFDVTCANVFDE